MNSTTTTTQESAVRKVRIVKRTVILCAGIPFLWFAFAMCVRTVPKGDQAPLTFLLFLFLIVPPIYFIPSWLAAKRDHNNFLAIYLLNFIGGLFWGLGWFAALVWALLKAPETRVVVEQKVPTDAASQIERLAELRARGLLSDEEFAAQKAKILSA